MKGGASVDFILSFCIHKSNLNLEFKFESLSNKAQTEARRASIFRLGSGRTLAWASRSRILYCKIAKDNILDQARAKLFSPGLQDMCPCPSSKGYGQAGFGLGPGRAKNA
jgi:hypothetical protein